MQVTDFYAQKLTSAQLLEGFRKQFNKTINLGKYDRVELEDIRNKLRTAIFQRENANPTADLLTNEEHQRDKAVMQLLNTRIREIIGENIKSFKRRVEEQRELRKKNIESTIKFSEVVSLVNESLEILLNEDEEGKAKAITAAGDIVNDFTTWMQRVGQYQTKSMIELADAIRADFGPNESETFKRSVGPALAATLETLTAQREAISNAVAVLAGEALPEHPMGAAPGQVPTPPVGGDVPEIDPAAPDPLNPDATDNFSAADAASSGRTMRESVIDSLTESHSIMGKLAG